MVDAPRLNRFGLQVGRTVAATARHQVTRWATPPDLSGAVESLRTDGFAAIPDLFDPDTVAELAETAGRVNESPQVAHFDVDTGGGTLHATWRADVPDDDRAVLDRFFLDPTVAALGSAAERLEVAPGAGRCTVQRLVQRADGRDLEATIHSDTFHPTHKIWLYLSDVTEDDGPLVYYPRSQRLSAPSLRAIYADSVASSRGSRAVADAEIAARGLRPEIFTCPSGTVVIANTFGYHGRIQGRPPGDRLVLHIELRPDPFRRPRRMPVDRSSARRPGR